MPEKILVVDDDVDTVRLVGLMLQRQGYQIVAANSGAQALAMAPNEIPDLIILDVMMPDMDGYEVTRRLRAMPTTKNTPIIMFTAKSMVDDKVTGFEAGVDDYLTKPTQPRELIAHVKAILARVNKSRIPQPEQVKREAGYVIGVVSAKGGLGCSTLATNLAVSLHYRSKGSVVVAELRPGEGSIGLDLGYLQPEGLTRLLHKKTSEITAEAIEREFFLHKTEIRLLMASYKAVDARLKSPEKIEAICQNLIYTANIILLDLGPAITAETEKALPFCNELVVPFESTQQILTRTDGLICDLAERGFGEGRINAVLYNRSRSELNMSLVSVQQVFKHPIAVVFTPAPEVIFQSARANMPLVAQQTDHLTSQQFIKLADLILKRVPIRS